MRLRWPWSRRETRDSGGSFQDRVLRQIHAEASGTAADHGATAAVEAASGALSRAFASARVEGPSHVVKAVTPVYLAQVGRDLIRRGQSLHVIRVSEAGMVKLIPADQWHFEGGHDPDSWSVRVSCYGPSTSTTWHVPFAGVVFLRWGSTSGQPYVGVGPLSWASTSSKLASEVERSLADEAGGPLAQLLAIPQDGGDGSDEDPLRLLKADIRTARGRALLVETTHSGWSEGRIAAPQRDWRASRLGPTPPEAMAAIRENAFETMLASTGTPPSLFVNSDGTAQREGLRRWHQNLVLPLARVLEKEIEEKLEGECKLVFDTYALDMVSRASVVDKLVRSGVSVAVALAAVGLED